jgi:DNA polymerase III subunit delta'
MSLAPIAGHTTVRAQLSDAVTSGRLPQVLLVTGARGVGKQRLALWLGQLLLCERPGAEPCGVCPSCRQVLGLVHPDLHWFVPVATPKGDADKQVEEVAAMLEAVMAERRQSPLWTSPDGMASHSIASARLIHRHASLTSVAGGWRVFVIGGADRLVPQESSPAAANSLLKLLEEPPRRSLFVLTTTAPGLVLPTIRSRSMPIRLGRLADEEVRQFLSVAKPELATESVVAAANGSIGAAVASGDGRIKANAAADDFLTAIAAGRAQAMERVLRQGAWAARGEFTALLDALADRLAERARRVLVPPGGRVTPGNPAGILAGVERVLVARERAQGNVNPQLLLAVLASELSELAAV